MLLDTGADVTLLPLAVVEQLGIVQETDKHYELIGFEGNPRSSAAILAEMVFLDLTFRGRFLLLEQDWGIIGRNVLNSLSFLFDGPQQTWERLARK